MLSGLTPMKSVETCTSVSIDHQVGGWTNDKIYTAGNRLFTYHVKLLLVTQHIERRQFGCEIRHVRSHAVAHTASSECSTTRINHYFFRTC